MVINMAGMCIRVCESRERGEKEKNKTRKGFALTWDGHTS